MSNIDFNHTPETVDHDRRVQEAKTVLNKAFNIFLETLPSSLRPLAQSQCYIAGGAIVSLVAGEPVQDYDLFVRTNAARDTFRAHYERNKAVEGNKYWVKAFTENAVTIKVDNFDTVFQLVTRFTGTPDRVFTTFDFEHVKAYFVPDTGEFHADVPIILGKNLIYTGEKDVFTLNTLKRMVKFVKRGYMPDDDSLINLHLAIQKRDLNDPGERRAQTVGFYGTKI